MEDAQNEKFDISEAIRFRKVVGHVIKEIRLSKKISKQQMVANCRVKKFRDIEQGLICPRLTTVIQFCKVLGVSASEVMRIVEDRYRPNRMNIFNNKFHRIFKQE